MVPTSAACCALLIVLIIVMCSIAPYKKDNYAGSEAILGRVWPRSFPNEMKGRLPAPVSYRDSTGLTEFGTGNHGEVGVSLGAVKSSEDGIPERWLLPSRPIEWYEPDHEDHYGAEGISTGTQPIYLLGVPDHEPDVGA